MRIGWQTWLFPSKWHLHGRFIGKEGRDHALLRKDERNVEMANLDHNDKKDIYLLTYLIKAKRLND